MFNGYKLWEQWATNYTDTMSEAMEQMLKPWQPVEETASPPPPDKSPVDTPPNPPSGQKNGKLPPIDPDSEPVWTFRGYQLRSGDFTAAMVHFFRAVINRADFWRSRLDSTTNWAVITTAAALSLSWDPQIIIVNTMLVTLFLYVEARRYRYYELYSYRARLLETEFFAAMLVPPFRPTPGWAETLADSLLNPEFPVSMWEAFGRRFRRNYIWIYFILWVAWFLHIWLQPTPANSLVEFINRAGIGQMSGWLVITSGILFNGFLIAVGLLTITLNHVSGDMMPGDGDFLYPSFAKPKPKPKPAPNEAPHQAPHHSWFHHKPRRKQYVALITTDQPQPIIQRVHCELGREATILFKNAPEAGPMRVTLMCPSTSTEITHLKTLVNTIDNQAMVIILPAEDVQGLESSKIS